MGYWSYQIFANDVASDEALFIADALCDRFKETRGPDGQLAVLSMLVTLHESGAVPMVLDGRITQQEVDALFEAQLKEAEEWVDDQTSLVEERKEELLTLKVEVDKFMAENREMAEAVTASVT